MSISYANMQDILMKELRLYHHPIAVTFFFDDEKLAAFKKNTQYVTPVKAITFCQWEIAARMKAQTVLAEKDQLGCTNGQVSFGWKEIDDKEIKSQAKYCVDLAQAERFLRSKPRLSPGLKAIAVGPLGDCVVAPDVIHFYCDSLQAYHLAVDFAAASDIHPLRPMVTMSSSACGGSVFTYMEKTFNMCPPCSGSYNAGKTERSEINVFIPGVYIEATVQRLLDRIEQCKTSSITRPGDPFPGADICKNCPLIIFKEGEGACASCTKS